MLNVRSVSLCVKIALYRRVAVVMLPCGIGGLVMNIKQLKRIFEFDCWSDRVFWKF